MLVKALTLDWLAANVQRGSAVFNNVGLVNVVFAVPFALVPKIVITPGTVSNKPFAAINKTVNGFTLSSNGAVTLSVDWLALSP